MQDVPLYVLYKRLFIRILAIREEGLCTILSVSYV